MSLKDSMLEGKLLKRSITSIDQKLALRARKKTYRKGKIDKDKIIMMTYDSGYTCNPSYIIDEVVRRELPVDIVLVINARDDPIVGRDRIPQEVRTVPRGTVEMFEELASAKIWIDNALNCVWHGIPKKPGQVYINTWHGSMGIKRLGGDNNWMEIAARCKDVTDYCVTNCTWEEEIFRSSFWPRTKFLQYGHPRNDMLINKEGQEEIRAAVMKEFKLDPSKKVLLYAPTFRDSKKKDYLKIDLEAAVDAMEERFGGEWVVFARLHFKDQNAKNRIRYNERIIDATQYEEMQRLLVVADAGITDYSSWAYDYILTRKPLFLFIPDIKSFDQDRGFYYPIDKTPFPRAIKKQELKECILNFDEEDYLKKVDQFLEEKGCYEDGHAAERVVDKIEEILGLSEQHGEL